jgi:trans-AT polyketide synthase/acyltransferase/oxidoreductase domain-containing protein
MIKKIKSETSAEEIERIWNDIESENKLLQNKKESKEEKYDSESVKRSEDMETVTKASNYNVNEEFQNKQKVLKETGHAFPEVAVSSLGSSEFKEEYNLKYAYITGGMYKGIASEEMVIKMGKAGMMSFFAQEELNSPKLKKPYATYRRSLRRDKLMGLTFFIVPTTRNGKKSWLTCFCSTK